VKLSAINLNLLLVLHAVLKEGSAQAAARRLHVTQSAVSNALARLRVVLADPLVVRSGRGLTPTPLAMTLAPHLETAVQALTQVMDHTRSFDATTTTRTFTIADSEELSDFPRVMQLFEQRLPSAVLRLVTFNESLSDGLAAGRADVALGPLDTADAGLHREHLYDVGWVLLVRSDHPLLRRRQGRSAELARLPRVEVRPNDRTADFSEDERARGRIRPEIAAVVPSFMAAALAVVRANCAARVPRGFGEAIARVLPLVVVASSSLPSTTVPIGLLWHERTHHDEGSRFFRQLVLDALRPARARDPIRARRRPH
jgi:DNA-binding transcriptional LysR family regulator